MVHSSSLLFGLFSLFSRSSVRDIHDLIPISSLKVHPIVSRFWPCLDCWHNTPRVWWNASPFTFLHLRQNRFSVSPSFIMPVSIHLSPHHHCLCVRLSIHFITSVPTFILFIYPPLVYLILPVFHVDDRSLISIFFLSIWLCFIYTGKSSNQVFIF